MSSYLSNLLTQTTSRYHNIRRTLLKDEEDGDTEDDSHISRVLRAYYTEKGRPFPPWLPPDPNDRRAITPQPYAQSGPSYMNRGPQVAGVQQQANSRPSSLSDLWDAPAQNNAPMQPQSLRNARRPVAQQAAATSGGGLAPPQARPLPSQRAGSYQSMQSQASGRTDYSASTPPVGGGGTAQDRLKARLWGGGARSGSPSNAGGQPSSYEQQPPGGNPYNAGGGGGSGGRDRRYGRMG